MVSILVRIGCWFDNNRIVDGKYRLNYRKKLILRFISWTTVWCLSLPVSANSALLPGVIDDVGNTISLPVPAHRIISLAPHLTELLFAAGAGDYVVGAVQFSDFPAQANTIPRVGNHSTFDYEVIHALSPQLIIAWQGGNPGQAIQKLRDLGFTIFLSDPKTLEDIPSTIQRLGELAGTQGKAELSAATFMTQYHEIQSHYANREPVRVFLEIWNQPMMTINGKHIINDVITKCGGRNVFSHLDALAPVVAIEPVLAADPQVIIASASEGKRPEWLQDWKQWPQLSASKYDNLFAVHADYLHRHTPRLLLGMKKVCEILDTARQRLPVKARAR